MERVKRKEIPSSLLFVLVASISILFSCGEENTNSKTQPVNTVAKQANFGFSSPRSGQKFHLNDTLRIQLQELNHKKMDSAIVYVRGEEKGVIYEKSEMLSTLISDSTLGGLPIKANVFFGNQNESIDISAAILSHIEPVKYSYEVINEYPHDKTAFTQGLFFWNGFLYEGTGQKGFSELRKVNLVNGKIEKRQPLESNLFGEGVTQFNDQIFQLTWQSRIGKVYDPNTFEQVSKFYYGTEGWGITSNSEKLIMSDGTHKLRFMNPADFRLEKELEVYDNAGAIGFLNELEWIDGQIYANVWQKDYIVVIDPNTGMVTAKINLSNLHPSSEERRGVLNGIAYDQENNRLFVTGKYWPSLYEIKLLKETTSF